MPKKDVKYYSIASPRQESIRFYRNLLSLVNECIIAQSLLYVNNFFEKIPAYARFFLMHKTERLPWKGRRSVYLFQHSCKNGFRCFQCLRYLCSILTAGGCSIRTSAALAAGNG